VISNSICLLRYSVGIFYGETAYSTLWFHRGNYRTNHITIDTIIMCLNATVHASNTNLFVLNGTNWFHMFAVLVRPLLWQLCEAFALITNAAGELSVQISKEILLDDSKVYNRYDRISSSNPMQGQVSSFATSAVCSRSSISVLTIALITALHCNTITILFDLPIPSPPSGLVLTLVFDLRKLQNII
jgi:hypothetical protein